MPSPTEDPKPARSKIETDVDTVIGHVLDGKVSDRDKKHLGDALDKSNAPLAGRAKSDAAIGRVMRLSECRSPDAGE